MNTILLTILVAAAAYLLGGFSTGITISRLQGVDIRKHGSKNTGASNVLRVLGLKSGVLTFIGDILKASIAVWLGYFVLGNAFGIERFGMMVGGLFAVLGHNWPVYYGFKGGKGVACSAAVIFFVDVLCALPAIAVAIAAIAITKYISLGSMLLMGVYMVLMCIVHWGVWPLCAFTVVLFVLCVWRHRANIGRLLNGTENKIGNKAKD